MRLGKAALEALKKEITGSLEPGDELVVAGWIGLSGTAEILLEKEEELKTRFSRRFLRDAKEAAGRQDIKKAKETAAACQAGAWYPLGSGGVLAGIWKMAEASEVGLEADLRKIPIRQEVVEICEYYGLNPYQLESKGALLIGCQDGDGLVQRLEEEGICARVIGRAKKGRERTLRNKENLRCLERPHKDELYKMDFMKIRLREKKRKEKREHGEA